SPNTLSDDTFNFIIEKYNHCCKNHEECDDPPRGNASAYPSRLLDVGTDQRGAVVLRNTNEFCDEKYACLSHCWGTVRPLTLNAKTLPLLSKGVGVSILPKTFQDAVIVTRRLRLQYLWIDSLCILQDDKDDWATESRRMGDIYAHAACTIAATSSNDNSDGLFFARSPLTVLPRRIHFDSGWHTPWLVGAGVQLLGTYVCDALGMVNRCIEDGPLNKRAWVSQERQLTTRVLHFTSTQVFWECLTDTACETYPKSIPTWQKGPDLDDATLLKREMSDLRHKGKKDSSIERIPSVLSRGLTHSTYKAWLLFRRRYSGCALTYPTDKLVAIQGIANRISQMTGDNFVEGIWQGHLIEELCWWEKKSEERSTNLSAPTWSWACSNLETNPSFLFQFHGEHSGRHTEAELIDLDTKAGASDKADKAALKLSCKLL
ncbi:heterokaryon incompatibility protein-domain-containing protein, partial [Alternaria rosae]|uniref:heterokaryon incompatibility protein-domain-containing protein n=1 Tax=Alternaria rosae TaxID=1187941 RepID=UPI001E8E1F0E